jgi:hypothetical protein
MTTQKKLALFSMIIVSLVIQSCIKDNDFDYDKIAASTWNPDVAVPLIHSSLTIQDIIASGDSSIVAIDSNHLVSLIYRGKIYSISGNELFQFADQTDNTPFTFSSGDSSTLYSTNNLTKTIPKTTTFTFPGTEQIDSMNIKSGSLEVEIRSTVPHSGSLIVSIPSLTNNGVALNFTVPFTASTGSQIIKIDSTSLSGYLFDLSSSGTSNDFGVTYIAGFTNSGTGLSITNKNFDVIARFKNIDFSSVFGYLGVHTIDLIEDSSRITLFDNFQSGSMYFEDPKMTFTMTNSFGLPINANVSSFAALRPDGTSVPITGSIPSPLPIGYPLIAGQSSTSNFILDKTNSNIQYVISQAPRYIVYTLNASSNIPSVPVNFLTDSSRLNADIQIDFPLRGYASNFTVMDTANFSLERIDEIESAVFRINIDNGFPARAYTQIYFTDSNYVVLDSMLLDPSNILVESADIDANGRVTQSTKRSGDEPFNKTRIEHLYNAKKLLIVSVIDTKDSPTRNVEIYDSYKLDVRIGVRAQLNVKFQ